MSNNNKIKIGIVVDSGNIGGIQKIAFHEMKTLNKNISNIDTELIILDKMFLLSSNNKIKLLVPKSFPGIRIPPFDFLKLHHVILLPYFIYKLKDYDIIISHNIISSLPVLLSKLIYKKPRIFVIYYHDTAYSIISLYSKKLIIRKIIKILEEKIIRYADIIIVNSLITQKIINTIYKVNSYLLYPGAKYKQNLKFENRDIDILFVTRWSKRRNLSLVIKLAKKYPNLKIVMAGSWSDKESLNEFIKMIYKNKINNIKIIIKNLSENDLIELYNRSKFYIQTEPVAFGMGALEALVNGCIPIIWSESGISQLFLIESLKELIVSNEEELINKLKLTMNNDLFINKQLIKLKNLRRKYSWEEHVKILLKIILEYFKKS